MHKLHLANHSLIGRDAAWEQHLIHLLMAYWNSASMLIFIILNNLIVLSNLSLVILLKECKSNITVQQISCFSEKFLPFQTELPNFHICNWCET